MSNHFIYFSYFCVLTLHQSYWNSVPSKDSYSKRKKVERIQSMFITIPSDTLDHKNKQTKGLNGNDNSNLMDDILESKNTKFIFKEIFEIICEQLYQIHMPAVRNNMRIISSIIYHLFCLCLRYIHWLSVFFPNQWYFLQFVFCTFQWL